MLLSNISMQKNLNECKNLTGSVSFSSHWLEISSLNNKFNDLLSVLSGHFSAEKETFNHFVCSLLWCTLFTFASGLRHTHFQFMIKK